MRKRSLRGVGRCHFSALCERLTFAWLGKRKANAPFDAQDFDAQDKDAQRTPRFAEKIGEVTHCFWRGQPRTAVPRWRSFAAPPGLRDLIMGCDPALACWAKFFGSPPGFGCVVTRAPDIRAWRHSRHP